MNGIDMETDFPSKQYYVKKQTYWHIPIFLGFLFIPVILYAVSMVLFGDWAGDDYGVYLFIGLIVIGYLCAAAFSKRLSRYSLRVHFDDQQITFERLGRDKETVKKSKSYQLKDVASFHDFNFGSDKTFKLKFNNGETFAIYGKEGAKNSGELADLIKDFKAFIQPDTSDSSTDKPVVTYANFYNSTWGRIVLWLCFVVVLAAIGLLVYVVFFDPDGFRWAKVKLPGILMFVSALYIARYYGVDEDE